MKVVVFFFLLIGLGYSAFSQDTTSKKNVPEKRNGYIIFPYDPSKPAFKSIFQENVTKADLDKGEIEQIDVILKKCVDDFNLNQELEYDTMREIDSSTSKSEFFINLATYQKQYVPVINEAKQKEVWVNAFCYVKGSDKWQKELIKEDDGGKCFFNVKINLATKNFSNFSLSSQ